MTRATLTKASYLQVLIEPDSRELGILFCVEGKLMEKLTFVLGGARSGKSSYAQRLAADHGGSVAFIATAQALDDEMAARIMNHKACRSADWLTLELPNSIGSQIRSRSISSDVILLDCLTLLVSNLIMQKTGENGSVGEEAAARLVDEEISELLDAIYEGTSKWIVVSNEVGMGLVPPYPMGRLYRDLLGTANQRIAANADRVIFMIAGIPMGLCRI